MAPVSDYERKRRENIAKNQELLRSLANKAELAGFIPSDSKPTAASRTPRKREAKPIQPVRASARLRGFKADVAVTAKREAEEAAERRNADERNKRMRVSGDLNVTDIITSGAWDSNGRLLDGLHDRGFQPPFDPQSAKETSDTELRSVIEEFSGLSLWENVEPSSMCLTTFAILC
jgi:WD repeat-containing protein 76